MAMLCYTISGATILLKTLGEGGEPGNRGTSPGQRAKQLRVVAGAALQQGHVQPLQVDGEARVRRGDEVGDEVVLELHLPGRRRGRAFVSESDGMT